MVYSGSVFCCAVYACRGLLAAWWAARVPKQATRATDDETRRAELQIEGGNARKPSNHGAREEERTARRQGKRAPAKIVKPELYEKCEIDRNGAVKETMIGRGKEMEIEMETG